MNGFTIRNTPLSYLYADIAHRPPGVSLENFASSRHPSMSAEIRTLCEYISREFISAHPPYDAFCRHVLLNWIREEDPPVFRSAHFGRSGILAVLDTDLRDVVRLARLDSDPKDCPEVIGWWLEVDRIARSRSVSPDESQLHEQGREGEGIVFTAEVDICRSIAKSLSPSWDALEDNFLGWDIQSYRCLENDNLKVFLEVKTSSNGKRFFISWREAQRAKVLQESWQLVLVNQTTKTVSYYASGNLLSILPMPNSSGIKWPECEIPTNEIRKFPPLMEYSY